ncbi:MAG: DEAD/DEAH box helicase [Proteobacteria bacterium]|nr:DEAD/DEAH box helicase [Pseudomonadota bacterium]MBS0573775.1 DEAD/DEAH box helicase [Pseudomonadota bacterium]
MTDIAASPPTLIPALAAALAAKGYDRLTPVQQAVTDPALGARDLLVSAQTGSGKTVGFGLAIAPTLLAEAGTFGPATTPLALVIAPTRELALQVRRELQWLYAQAGATISSCVGGMDMRDEVRALDRGAHIVVGTPGRICDHLRRGTLDPALMRAVVLDEADEMLDLGFREDLETILRAAPEDRRTLMFSATVPKAIEALARDFQKDALRIRAVAAEGQHADIAYHAVEVAPTDTENAIINLLRFHEAPNAIIFCNTRAAVNRLHTRLTNRAFAAVALSGELSQSERSHALQAMRDGRARVCVATDVAARGIDLPNLDLVIHAELPTNGEVLLHRSGRTGRAGRKGISALIVPRNRRRRTEALLGQARVAAEWVEAPTADAVRARDEARLLADPVWGEEVSEREAALAVRLLDGQNARRVAAAFVRLYMSARSAPEELAGAQAPRDPATFGPGRWFALSIGRRDHAEPRRILPMVCRAGNLGRGDVGAIRVQESETFVEILLSRAPAFLKALGRERALENGVTVRPLDAPPFGDRTPAERPAHSEGPSPRQPKPHRKGPPPRRDAAGDPTPGPAPEAATAETGPKPRPAAQYSAKKSGAKSAPDAPGKPGKPHKPKGKPPQAGWATRKPKGGRRTPR